MMPQKETAVNKAVMNQTIRGNIVSIISMPVERVSSPVGAYSLQSVVLIGFVPIGHILVALYS